MHDVELKLDGALEAMKRHTGFDLRHMFRLVAELRLVRGDQTPFFGPQISGKAVWILDFEMPLALRAALGQVDPYRRFQVRVDAMTGQLLNVVSIFDGVDADLLPEPSAISATQQLRDSGEVYTTLPPLEAKISLLDALNRIHVDGTSSPLHAKEIVAHYVVHARMGGAPRAVWAVTLRGIPPLEPIGPAGGEIGEIPVWQRNHIRNVVDAKTGEVLFANTVPQPDGDPCVG